MIRSLGLAIAFAACGCAATAPILAEPRALPSSEIRVQAGGAALAPIAGDTGAMSSARETLAKPPPPSPVYGQGKDAVVRSTLPGTAVAYAVRPGVAPVVRASFGVAPNIEATLKYGGRDVGGGARWVFIDARSETASTTTLSLGVDAHVMLRAADDVLGSVVTNEAKAFGGVVPLILAWRSDAGLVSAYLATQLGFDAGNARYALPTLELKPEDAPVRRLDFRRTFAAATIGIGLGFRGVRAIVELGIERDWLHAENEIGEASIRLWSLAPAFAISTTL